MTDEEWDRMRARTGALEMARDALRLASVFADSDGLGTVIYEAEIKVRDALRMAEQKGGADK